MLQKTYQGRRQGPHLYETAGDKAPKWYIVDAKDQVVGRLATVLARVLVGKHKATYSKHVDSGDFVVVVNADKVAFTRKKWDQKVYYKHTGYVGGLKETKAKEMREKNPEYILKHAIWGMLNKSNLAKRQLSKLKIYSGSEHPHAAQMPAELPAFVKRKTILDKK